MRRTLLFALTGPLLGGCLEKVDPISGTGGIVHTGTGSGSVTLIWQPPTENADGSLLTDLAGYNIYVGTTPNNYDYMEIRLHNPGLTAYVVENLDPGTYYFAATAVNTSGTESRLSSEVTGTVR